MMSGDNENSDYTCNSRGVKNGKFPALFDAKWLEISENTLGAANESSLRRRLLLLCTGCQENTD